MLTVVLVFASPDNYTQGIKGPLLRLYASVGTPLFEEMALRTAGRISAGLVFGLITYAAWMRRNR